MERERENKRVILGSPSFRPPLSGFGPAHPSVPPPFAPPAFVGLAKWDWKSLWPNLDWLDSYHPDHRITRRPVVGP